MRTSAFLFLFFLTISLSAVFRSGAETAVYSCPEAQLSATESICTPQHPDYMVAESVQSGVSSMMRTLRKLHEGQQKENSKTQSGDRSQHVVSVLHHGSKISILSSSLLGHTALSHHADYLKFGILVI